jgi:hypothetical protein
MPAEVEHLVHVEEVSGVGAVGDGRELLGEQLGAVERRAWSLRRTPSSR